MFYTCFNSALFQSLSLYMKKIILLFPPGPAHDLHRGLFPWDGDDARGQRHAHGHHAAEEAAAVAQEAVRSDIRIRRKVSILTLVFHNFSSVFTNLPFLL